MLDKGEAVKKFVDALQQLTNPDMIFRVTLAMLAATQVEPPHV